MDWPNKVTAIAAAYAAIVATGALALEIRRWFESGPRLVLTIIPKARFYGGVVEDLNTYLSARITNRGNLPTTVTNYALLQYRSIFHRILNRPARAAIVANPMPGGFPLPYLLNPGTEWTGAAIYDDELSRWAASGKLFAAIFHSHSSRPVQQNVKLPKEVEDIEESD